MDNKYLILFREIARTTEVLAERVMAYDKEKKDEKGEQTAQTMRDDFAKLHDKLSASNLDTNSISRIEWAKILVGAMVISNNLSEEIEQRKKALSGYKIDLIPKLNRIINETKTDEEAITLANELFEISENK
jgi:hypothetical protein